MRFADFQRADPPAMREVSGRLCRAWPPGPPAYGTPPGVRWPLCWQILAALPRATEKWLAGQDERGRPLELRDVDAARQHVLARGAAISLGAAGTQAPAALLDKARAALTRTRLALPFSDPDSNHIQALINALQELYPDQ